MTDKQRDGWWNRTDLRRGELSNDRNEIARLQKEIFDILPKLRAAGVPVVEAESERAINKMVEEAEEHYYAGFDYAGYPDLCLRLRRTLNTMRKDLREKTIQVQTAHSGPKQISAQQTSDSTREQVGSDLKEELRQHFNPDEYLETYWKENPDAGMILKAYRQMPPDPVINLQTIIKDTGLPSETVENVCMLNFHRRVAGAMLKVFPEGQISILDVGGGPTVYQHILMSLTSNRITHSDLLDQNLDAVGRWVRGEDDSHNWDPYFELVREMLREDKDYQKTLDEMEKSPDERIKYSASHIRKLLDTPDITPFKSNVRTSLTQGGVVHGDILVPGLELENKPPNGYEVVTANFSLEETSGDKKVFEQGVKNVMAEVKTGGYLMMTMIRDAGSYAIGENQLSSAKVNENDIQRICAENDFDIEMQQILEGGDKEKLGYDGMVFVLARKK